MNDFSDRLSVIGLRFDAQHGVHDWEKEQLQPFEVDLVLHADLAAAARRDDLSATADYGVLVDLVRGIVLGPSFDLIEALAGAIADGVLAATDPGVVRAVEVRVRKPRAPLDVSFDTVEAALTRRRPDPSGTA
ncbi:MAG: dihydroneopterin aldolase [Candidatus Limnocylindria bacterium]